MSRSATGTWAGKTLEPPARDAAGRFLRHAVPPEAPSHPVAEASRAGREVEAQAHAPDHHLLAVVVAGDDEVVRRPLGALPGGGADPLVHQLARVREGQALQHAHHRPVVDELVQRVGVAGPRRAQDHPFGGERVVRHVGAGVSGRAASSGSCR